LPFVGCGRRGRRGRGGRHGAFWMYSISLSAGIFFGSRSGVWIGGRRSVAHDPLVARGLAQIFHHLARRPARVHRTCRGHHPLRSPAQRWQYGRRRQGRRDGRRFRQNSRVLLHTRDGLCGTRDRWSAKWRSSINLRRRSKDSNCCSEWWHRSWRQNCRWWYRGSAWVGVSAAGCARRCAIERGHGDWVRGGRSGRVPLSKTFRLDHFDTTADLCDRVTDVRPSLFKQKLEHDSYTHRRTILVANCHHISS